MTPSRDLLRRRVLLGVAVVSSLGFLLAFELGAPPGVVAAAVFAAAISCLGFSWISFTDGAKTEVADRLRGEHDDTERIVVGEDDFAIAVATNTYVVAFADIHQVAVYKRDEVTTDLICCDIVTTDGASFWAHEEVPGFDALMRRLEALPGFDRQWREAVMLPAFAENRTVVFEAGAMVTV